MLRIFTPLNSNVICTSGKLKMPIFLPPPIRRSKLCERCGLWYPKKKVECTHCKDLGDEQVLQLKERYEGHYEGNSRLGTQFLIVAGFIALIVLGVIAFAL